MVLIMAHMNIKIKEKKYDNYKYRDWDQGKKIKNLLLEQRITMYALANAINENYKAVCAAIWGVPGRRNRRIEQKIADFFNVTWESLFNSTCVKVTA